LNSFARKRAANKRRKIKTLGKSRSTETDDEDDDAEEGKTILIIKKPFFNNQFKTLFYSGRRLM
jgi:hypothetical protein